MRLTTFLLSSFVSSVALAAKLDKRCSLRREPITMKDGLAYGSVKVGTPQTSFSVLFDTSQSLTWVPSTDCHTSICKQHSDVLYNANASTTAVNLHQKESIRFAEGVCVDVRLYQDSVSVAGLSVPHQLFGAAYSVKGLGGEEYLGYLGLGAYAEGGNVKLSSNSSSHYSKRQDPGSGSYATNAFQSAYGASSQQFSMVSSNSGGFYQKRDNENEHNAEFILGGVDHNVYKGSIAYFPLPTCDYGDSPYWKTELKCVKLGDKIDFKLSAKTLASFSTGTSYILAPTEQADLLHAAIDGQYDDQDGFYKVQCPDQELENFPTLTFDLKGHRISLPPKAYLKKEDDSTCKSLINRGSDKKNWVLGGYFSRWFYQIFDASNSQIGLAIPKDGSGVEIKKINN